MRVLLAVAAFLLASGSAQAQYTFELGGHTIHVDPDRGTVSIPGVFDNTGRKTRRARTVQEGERARGQTKVKIDPQPTRAATETSAPPSTAVGPAPAAPAATSTNAPTEAAAVSSAATAPPSAPTQQKTAPAVAPAPTAITASVPTPAASLKPVESAATALPSPSPSPFPASDPVERAQQPAAAARDPISPIGLWLTEEDEGKVRIEQCGANLCGYSVDAKSNQNREQVLINMKPAKDQKWSGRIVDPKTGSSYDSTIALMGVNALRVQGCAFGGMFCGGQTWTRLN